MAYLDESWEMAKSDVGKPGQVGADANLGGFEITEERVICA